MWNIVVIVDFQLCVSEVLKHSIQKKYHQMADQGLEGNQSVNLEKHPSGIVPTIMWVTSFLLLNYMLPHCLWFWLQVFEDE